MKKKKNVYKPKRHPHLAGNILSLFFTLLIASFFIVIGYSVAKPFGEIGEVKNSSSSPDSTVITESYGKDTENISKGTKAYWIKDMEIESLEALDSILDKVDKNYNMVVIPLKIEGGKLNYNSSNEGAVLAEAGNEIPISSITEAVKSYGFTPVASVNAMQDNLYPKANKNAGFLIKSTKTLWLDSPQKDKGKPWMDPASSDTREYLSSLSGANRSAGFEYIIRTMSNIRHSVKCTQ